MLTIIKKLSLIYTGLLLGFILFGQLILDNGILTKATISCDKTKCTIFEKTFTGNLIQQFSFPQTAVEKMWLQEDLKGYYKLWMPFEEVTECPTCKDLNLIRLPFSWWFKNNAETFWKKLKKTEQLEYTQYNRALSWLGTIMFFSTLLVIGLYKCKQIHSIINKTGSHL